MTDPTPGDDDFDQYRIPQGSLFLEVYCTRNHARNPRFPNATSTSFPRELYDANGLLDLGRLAPADPGSGVRVPVWRVVISEPLNDASSPESPLERSERGSGTGKPDSTSFNPVVTLNPAHVVQYGLAQCAARHAPGRNRSDHPRAVCLVHAASATRGRLRGWLPSIAATLPWAPIPETPCRASRLSNWLLAAMPWSARVR